MARFTVPRASQTSQPLIFARSPLLRRLGRVALRRPEHISYLLAGLGSLSSNYTSLDASRPWLCYWILHSVETLGPSGQIPAEYGHHIVDFLQRCQHKVDGGFCGGPYPGQMAHLAPTYAAVNALVTLGTEEAYGAIDRAALRRFLLSMKRPDGGFCMHDDGECDVRGAYTAVAVASLCNVLDDELRAGTAEWIEKCQTYEGGIGATPGEEAHGGYTFCGLATMVLLGRADLLNLDLMAHWLAHRQMAGQGGFQGRTNKLVDGCYSFWQGGCFPLLQAVLAARGDMPASGVSCLFNAEALLDYIMVCCQCKTGGLRDKPGKGRDYYHTCYCISGASVAATMLPQPTAQPPADAADAAAAAAAAAAAGAASCTPPRGEAGGEGAAGGVAQVAVPADWQSMRLVNPVYNVSAAKVERALAYFSAAPPVA